MICFYVTGLEQYAEVQIVVFNRWGNEVYKNSDYKNDWAGLNNNGNQLEEDTYYLVLTLDNDEYKGYVVIKKVALDSQVYGWFLCLDVLKLLLSISPCCLNTC